MKIKIVILNNHKGYYYTNVSQLKGWNLIEVEQANIAHGSWERHSSAQRLCET
jgi:hypothetical protein